MKRLLALALLCACCATVSADSLTEAEAKAAFLYKLTWFVTWPLPEWMSERPLVLGLVGADPFGVMLDTLLANKRVNGHPVVIRRFQPQEDITRCHVLFIVPSDIAPLPGILARLQGHPILTVSDVPGFAKAGGMVQLLTEGTRLRFAIAPDMLMQAGLRLSSDVLQLAQAP